MAKSSNCSILVCDTQTHRKTNLYLVSLATNMHVNTIEVQQYTSTHNYKCKEFAWYESNNHAFITINIIWFGATLNNLISILR